MRERNREIWEGKAEQRTKRGHGKLRENVPGRRNPLRPEGKEDKVVKCSII